MLIIKNLKIELFLGIILCFIVAACSDEVNDQRDSSGNQKMLMPPPTQLQWSPDGQWIVYIRLQAIQMFNTNTKEAEVLTGTGKYNHPVWSSDGKKIAYDYSPEGLPADIWIKPVHPNPGVSVRLTTATQSDSFPEWSPDGKKIVFQSHRTGNWDIWMIASDGSGEPVQLTDNTSFDQIPVWSPDGKEIAFRSNRTGDYEIFLLSLDDMQLLQLTEAEGTERNYQWSPDGTEIAYRAKRNSEYNIWITDTNGSGTERQVSTVGDVGILNWSPDGRYIIYQSSDYIFCRRTDGTEEEILLAEAFEPLWSPDGEKIAFVRFDEKENEFVIKIEQVPERLK